MNIILEKRIGGIGEFSDRTFKYNGKEVMTGNYIKDGSSKKYILFSVKDKDNKKIKDKFIGYIPTAEIRKYFLDGKTS